MLTHEEPWKAASQSSRAGEPAMEDQRRFWNHWNLDARCPDHLNQWALLRGEAILRTLSSLALEQPRIIDLGCGTGWLTEKLAAYGPVTGIDLSDEAVALARQRAPHINYIAADVFEMPLPQEHFDVVISQDVLAHIVDQQGYITLAARLLKPGGHLIITTTNRFVVERMSLPPQPPEHIERWLTMRSLRKLLRTHFTVLRTATVMPAGSKGVLRVVNSPKLESILKPLIAPAALAAAKERLGLGYNLVALARKRARAVQTPGRRRPTHVGS
jgi:2-polyprenyl-3-methyl-5-hydroxy-6-metoxy-1,4-benzoquinol methylase